MSTKQLLIKSLNDLKPFKSKKEKIKYAQDVQSLKFQWLKEFVSDNHRLVAYIKFLEKSIIITDNLDLENPTKYISDSKKKIESDIISNSVKRKLSDDEIKQLNKDDLEFQSAVLMLYVELFNTEDLKTVWKITFGKEIIKNWQILIDLNSLSNTNRIVNEKIQSQINVVSRRVMELELNMGEPELHYWPTGAVPFHQAMKKLRDNKFILDISLAVEIFKRFDNQTGQTLKWNGSKRELIYFLLVLYGGRNHIAETITDIAFKIFTLKRVCPRKQFTSDIVRIEEIINSDFEYAAGSKYYCLKDILVPSQK